MKKVIILLSIVALAFGTMGATCLQNVQTTVCNAPVDVIAQIQVVIDLALLGVTTFIPGSKPYTDAAATYATAGFIQAGVCISVTQLNNLIAFIQDPEVKALEQKQMMKKGPMKAVAINPQAFIDWRNKVAK